MSEVKIVAIAIVTCVAIIVTGLTVTKINANILAAEVQKAKAAEGHKFKFGVTKDKEEYNETK